MPSSSQAPRESSTRRQRQRRSHQRVDSNGDLEPRPRDRPVDEQYSDSPSPSKSRPKRAQHRERRSSREPESQHTRTTASSSAALSAGQLAQLDQLNRQLGWDEQDPPPPRRQRDVREEPRVRRDVAVEREREERDIDRERRRQEHRERKRRRREEEERALVAERDPEEPVERHSKHRRREKGRVVSGQRLERGEEAYYSEKDEVRDDVRLRGGGTSSDLEYDEDQRRRKRRKRIFIGVGVLILILAIVIPVGVVLSQKKSGDPQTGGAANATTTQPANSNLEGMTESDVPQQYQGTYLDPFSWYDTDDFNVTFTSEMVGGLSVMGLNDTWDDDKRANDKVPGLGDTWQYGTTPIRGINIGGWLCLEPLITPSFFEPYTTRDNVIDEYTLTAKLGASRAKSMLEQHYSSFVSEQTFADIQAAGFDHVRIPFSYWAVTTYDGDPYVPNVSWRYLLRGIEWARKYGLRINLDLHGAPGSQNGWNHSGRQGAIGWLNGTDGTVNGDRTLAIHQQLSTFFTQPRYENIIAMYGLVNEPRMVELDTATVLNWTQTAVTTVRNNNFTGVIIFGDGFMGLDKWQGQLQNEKNLLLDVHQYVIFNVQQIVLNHHDKIKFACEGWTNQATRSMNTATGFGPTLCGEWSQADTDCARYLNNVGVGSRWEGTLNMINTPGGSSDGSQLSPTCPTANSPTCSCESANADPSTWSAEYKQWLLTFAEAQMHSFEQGWGWFYWTWQTESAAQWSYKAGLAAGTMPNITWDRSFDCSQDIPDFGGLGLLENY
ncbi:hypothetical protein LTR56_013795 [Elasticomyces elasticus]|nr:hypothetical protein LTR56_013795 [Elasticomyces elasticus]KAK3647453.1 hypothetical protein LTR22_013746 [Elasticomyces elasticus]KAK4904335.1 hypothetical protein LTR49_026189 [Elasticomyces elasticus]KAK5750203.1 hypothetical protein LTS12_019767 [Elasticomyces elasticus]